MQKVKASPFISSSLLDFILFSDLGMIYDWFLEFSSQIKVNVIAYDYEGYGKAPGIPNEKSCYENIEFAFNLVSDFSSPSEVSILILLRPTTSLLTGLYCMEDLLEVDLPLISPINWPSKGFTLGALFSRWRMTIIIRILISCYCRVHSFLFIVLPSIFVLLFLVICFLTSTGFEIYLNYLAQ